ncbi:hypothetical protein [Calothrix sp. NIES-2100]
MRASLASLLWIKVPGVQELTRFLARALTIKVTRMNQLNISL